jgi:hypothetical protein
MLRTCWVLLFVVLIGAPVFAQDEGGIPEEAEQILEKLEQDLADNSKKFREENIALTLKSVEELQKLQDKYTKDGHLDEAVAVRNLIKLIKAGDVLAMNDPGTLEKYAEQAGKVYYFRVAGATDGIVYGTGVYTTDSPLATAAVHAGVLKYGETGLVKVTILPGRSHYDAYDNNEVLSREWDAYHASYRVEPLLPPMMAPPAKPMARPEPKLEPKKEKEAPEKP